MRLDLYRMVLQGPPRRRREMSEGYRASFVIHWDVMVTHSDLTSAGTNSIVGQGALQTSPGEGSRTREKRSSL